MRRAAAVILTLSLQLHCILASRTLSTAAGPPTNGSSSQQAVQAQQGPGLQPVQPWQPWQQWKQELQTNASSGSKNSTQQDNQATPLRPGVQFVSLSQQERPAELKQASQQLQQQQERNTSGPFECGKPYMPCGSAIPNGKTCEKGAGWCEPGYFCGFEGTSTEPSRCLPLPEKCGQAGNPCCPSNADKPHTGITDKLSKKPFCKDGSYCFYYPPMPELNNGDVYAGNKGAYACTPVAQDCGTGPGKPCCPFAYRIATNPPLNRTGCSGQLFCNYEPSFPGTLLVRSEYMAAFTPGTCEQNTADCGRFNKVCCITTTPASTYFGCGARWNETGRRGYCADPADANNSVGFRGPTGRALLDVSSKQGPDNAGSSSGSAQRRRRSSYQELVCTPCPARSEDVAENPSKYWPC